MRPVDEKHAKRTLAQFDKLYEPLRDVAMSLGYALTVHGSLRRDIDLVAIPWTSAAVSAAQMAEALRQKTEELNGIAFLSLNERSDEYFRKGCPGAKPHGRLVWSFHLGGGPYIDLSVMPRSVLYDTAEDVLGGMRDLDMVEDGMQGVKRAE